MIVEVESVDGRKSRIKKITELSFIQTYGVACDACLISFKDDDFNEEIYRVRVFNDDRLIFNGYCDNQKRRVSDNGVSHSIYARSSACILVDTKSQPFTFVAPSSRQLYVNYAKDKGFGFALPDISRKDKYEVQMGTSCFGAINNFVSLLTGSQLYVDCNNTLRLHRESEDIESLGMYKILSSTEITNRSQPLAQINFKNSLSSDYTHHTKSGIADDLKLVKQEYVNLTTLPQWQRDYTIKKKLDSSYISYKTIEVVVSGYCNCVLGQRFSYKGEQLCFDDYILREKHYTFNKSCETTKLLLKKKIDTGGFTYVA